MRKQLRQLARRVPGPIQPLVQKTVYGTRWLRASWLGHRNRGHFRDLEAYCLFVGPRRSGTTLLGQILNAHPNVVIAHQSSALAYVDGWTRNQHFQRILDKDREFVIQRNCKWNGYDYRVPGQWQGRFTSLRVIGDKGADKTSKILQRDPEILKRLEQKTSVPMKFLMVVRNPFDVIGNYRKHRLFPTVQEAVDDYFAACATCVELMMVTRPEQWYHLRLESFVQDPARVIRELCRFLGVDCTDEYVDACSRRVFPSTKNSRGIVDWEADIIQAIHEKIQAYDFLAGYTFTADASAGR